MQELFLAAQDVNPFLLTSNDGHPYEPAVVPSTGAGLRAAAEHIDKRDAAIYRFRRALIAARRQEPHA